MSSIVVRKDALSKPLLQTNEASVVEFYNNGEMNALLVKQFSDGMWALVTKVDPDWEATLIRMGYINIKSTPSEFLTRNK